MLTSQLRHRHDIVWVFSLSLSPLLSPLLDFAVPELYLSYVLICVIQGYPLRFLAALPLRTRSTCMFLLLCLRPTSFATLMPVNRSLQSSASSSYILCSIHHSSLLVSSLIRGRVGPPGDALTATIRHLTIRSTSPVKLMVWLSL